MWHEEICEKKHDFKAPRRTEEHEGNQNQKLLAQAA
jgi:hypothetical protein